MRYLSFLLFLSSWTVSALAAGFDQIDVERELKAFYRGYVRANRDAVEEKSTSKAVDKLVAKTMAAGIMQVTEKQDERLRSGKDATTNEECWASLEKLRKIKPSDTESLYLLEESGANDEKRSRHRGAEAFIYAQMAEMFHARTLKSRSLKVTSALAGIAAAYQKKKKAEPESLPAFADLGLEEEAKQFVSIQSGEKMDWVYLGDKAVPLRFPGEGRAVAVTPQPVESAHLLVLDDAEVLRITIGDFEQHLKNAPKASAPGKPGEAPAAATPPGIVGEVVKAYKAYRDSHAGKHPKVISQIGIDAEKLAIEGKRRWVFVTPATKERQVVKTPEGKAVILCENQAKGGQVRIVLEDGRMATTGADFLERMKPDALD